jgi:hypothetical protein
MPLTEFQALPDDARLWTFAASRRLSDRESAAFLAATDEFLGGWSAHRVPLATSREFRYGQFLLVAVDEAPAGASGCSIDALVRFIRQAEVPLGVSLTDNRPVWFRDDQGEIRCESRDRFKALAREGAVTGNTIVFDNTIETVGALRGGRWERPASESWHARILPVK